MTHSGLLWPLPVCLLDRPPQQRVRPWPESTKSVCDLCLSTCLSTDPKSQSVEPRPKSTSCGARCPKKTSNMNHLVIAWIYVRFSLKILRLSPRRQLMFLNLSFFVLWWQIHKDSKRRKYFSNIPNSWLQKAVIGVTAYQHRRCS